MVVSIAREKAQREEVRILKSGGLVELSDLSGAREVSHKFHINVMRKQLAYTLPTFNNEGPEPTSKFLYGILLIELMKVSELHFFG